jgi:hypothetical protein
VEIHLGDENSHKGDARDKRCMIEVRLEGRPPQAVTHKAPTVSLAVDGAAEKIKAALEHSIGKLSHR